MTKFTYPAFTVDLVVISHTGKEAKLLLVERKNEPFKGNLALPGGFVNIDELTCDAALRELQEETGVVFDPRQLVFIDHFEKINRDPRGRVISFAYGAIANGTPTATAGDDAATAAWYALSGIKDLALAFDHEDIIKAGLWKFGFNNRGEWPWPR
jgi:8-oxo-dGTP diphosphatase